MQAPARLVPSTRCTGRQNRRRSFNQPVRPSKQLRKRADPEQRSQRNRLRRRPKLDGRVPLASCTASGLEGRQDRLPGLLAGLVRHQVAVLATAGNVTRACGQSCNSDDPDRFRRRRRPCRFSTPRPSARSMRPLPRLSASDPMPYSSLPTHSSSAAPCNLPPWRRATGFRRLMCCVIMWQPAG